MLYAPSRAPSPRRPAHMLRAALPAYEAAGVTLALETYEQVATADLVGLVDASAARTWASASTPPTSSPASRRPRDAVEPSRRYVAERARQGLRVRPPGRLGRLHLLRRPMGERPARLPAPAGDRPAHERGINEIVEHWLPWQGDPETTIRTEREWTQHHPRIPEEQVSTTVTRRTDLHDRRHRRRRQDGHARLQQPRRRPPTRSPTSRTRPPGQERTRQAGRELTDAATAVADADIVVFAVPDLALGSVTADSCRR